MVRSPGRRQPTAGKNEAGARCARMLIRADEGASRGADRDRFGEERFHASPCR